MFHWWFFSQLSQYILVKYFGFVNHTAFSIISRFPILFYFSVRNWDGLCNCRCLCLAGHWRFPRAQCFSRRGSAPSACLWWREYNDDSVFNNKVWSLFHMCISRVVLFNCHRYYYDGIVIERSRQVGINISVDGKMLSITSGVMYDRYMLTSSIHYITNNRLGPEIDLVLSLLSLLLPKSWDNYGYS